MIKQYSLEWGGKTLSVEIGKIAKQANGSCTVRYGDTVVLVTATMGNGREGIDFLPLSVECEERLYAAGKIKSSRFLKREGRPTHDAVIVGRMIDRSIRPLFDSKIRKEIQVVFTTLAFDKENDYDVPAMVGASIALGISDIPWGGPIGGIRVGRVGKEWVINPSYEAREKGDLELFIAGTPEKTTMVEAEAGEVTESDMMEAVTFGAKHLGPIQAFIEKIVGEIGKPKRSVNELLGMDEETAKEKAELIAKSREFIFPKIREYLFASQ